MIRFKTLLSVFVFACLAGLVRYSLTSLFPSSWTVIAINFIGIFLLVYYVKGILPAKKWSQDLLTAWGVGFLGGLTTLASPLLDLVLYLQAGDIRHFIYYLSVHLFGGLLVAYLADLLVRRAGDKA